MPPPSRGSTVTTWPASAEEHLVAAVQVEVAAVADPVDASERAVRGVLGRDQVLVASRARMWAM